MFSLDVHFVEQGVFASRTGLQQDTVWTAVMWLPNKPVSFYATVPRIILRHFCALTLYL
jgi:hypothetical protein